MKYLRAALVLVALAAGGWTVTQIIGGRDADNGDSLGRWTSPVPSPSLAGMPGPPVPAPTPTPKPTPSPEPAPPPPEPATAPAPPVPEPERGEPPPEPAAGLEGDVVEVIHQVFGQNAGAALKVAYCETGGTFDPGVVGDSGEIGLFQIHPIHFVGLDVGRLYEPRYNAEVAYGMSAGGTDWSHWWNCRP